MAPDSYEIARRIGAAMAYAELGKENGQVRRELPRLLGVSTRTLERMLGKGIAEPRRADWDQLRRIADYCGLPPEFFSADFDRLPLIVPEGGFLVRRPTTPAEEERTPRVPHVKVPPDPVPERTPPTQRPARKGNGGRDPERDGSRTPSSSRRSQ